MKLPVIPLLLLAVVVGCDSSGPTAPDDELDVTFRGTFTPTSVAADEVCKINLEAIPTGGSPPYRCSWSMSWINQASSARGYPNECEIDISLPDLFGGGLYPMDLLVRDRRDRDDEVARAGTDVHLDCESSSQVLFFGS